MSQTIECRYSCHGCGLEDVAVQVPVRGRENVVEWLEGVAGLTIGIAHLQRSPQCHEKHFDIKIPLAAHENARVGDPTEH